MQHLHKSDSNSTALPPGLKKAIYMKFNIECTVQNHLKKIIKNHMK